MALRPDGSQLAVMTTNLTYLLNPTTGAITRAVRQAGSQRRRPRLQPGRHAPLLREGQGSQDRRRLARRGRQGDLRGGHRHRREDVARRSLRQPGRRDALCRPLRHEPDGHRRSRREEGARRRCRSAVRPSAPTSRRTARRSTRATGAARCRRPATPSTRSSPSRSTRKRARPPPGRSPSTMSPPARCARTSPSACTRRRWSSARSRRGSTSRTRMTTRSPSST